mgnify:CR=1 FL=1
MRPSANKRTPKRIASTQRPGGRDGATTGVGTVKGRPDTGMHWDSRGKQAAWRCDVDRRAECHTRPGFSTVLAASSPLLANASAGRRGGMGMEPAYPEVLATHLCDNHGIRPVQRAPS